MNGGPKPGCLFGNARSRGPKLLHTHDCPGGSMVSKVRVEIGVSVSIRVSLALVLQWGPDFPTWSDGIPYLRSRRLGHIFTLPIMPCHANI